MSTTTCAADRQHTGEPWPAFDDQSNVVQHHPHLRFMPASDPAEMHSFVQLTLVDYLRARVCVNACAGVPSQSLQALDGDYGQQVDTAVRSMQMQIDAAVSGLDEALEIIGPIEGDDETSALMTSVRRLQKLSTQLKNGYLMEKSAEDRRAELLEVLVDDKTTQFVSNGKADIEEVVRTGFVGFESMSWDQLVQCAHDAGLPQRSESIRALIEGEAS